MAPESSLSQKMPATTQESLARGAKDDDATDSNNSNTLNHSSETAGAETPETPNATHVAPAKRDWRFWALLVSISLAGLLTALEGTITSTALPSIVNELGGGHLYIWIVNGYLFAM